MGMTASQARFLCLTARKSNVEFEGQQINQQRTCLSNQSAGYYSQLCNLVVPTPPSVDQYTKVSYTFDDGALTNTITSLVARKGEAGQNVYSLSYIQKWQDDYAVTAASSSMIAKDLGNYKIGSTVLRKLTESQMKSYYYTDDNNIEHLCHVNSEGKMAYYSNEIPEKDIDTLIPVEQRQYYPISQVAGVQDGNPVTGDGTTPAYVYYDSATEKYYYSDDNEKSNPIKNFNASDYMLSQVDPSSSAVKLYRYSEGSYFPINESLLVEKQEQVLSSAETDSDKFVEKPTDMRKTDAYLKTLDDEQFKDLMEQERYYRSLLNSEYNNDQDGDWFVRYVKNGTTGAYVPYFYKAGEEGGKDGNGVYDSNYADNFAKVNCYSIGSATKTNEVLNRTATIEKDSSGRYISITVYSEDKIDDKGITYSLTATTTTDEDAYNNALNQYQYDQAKYDKMIQDINSKLEILQQQDKSLELNLKHLDTEEKAISTEIDSVSKVLEKNISGSFGVFKA